MKLSELSAVTDLSQLAQRSRTSLMTPEEVGVLAAYLWFRDNFGPPNGGIDETRSQWCYLLKTGETFIEAYDWKVEAWSVGIYEPQGDKAKAETVSRQFIELISRECARYSAQIQKLAQEATSFVFANPYLLYYETGEELLARASSGSPGDRIMCGRAALFMFMSAFEGFLNLIYEMYLKPELRDDRISERLGREQIDIKVRLAPTFCVCFASDRFDHESTAFSRFHSVVNARNDLVHAKLTKSMKHPVVRRDNFTFVVDVPARDRQGLARHLGVISPSDVELVKGAMDDMIRGLLQAMKPRYRREFAGVLDHDYFSVSIEDGETIVDWE